MGQQSKHPLVSYILLSYNQEKYIREAVEATLAQTYQPLEIIFSDDCSTDQTYPIILTLINKYKGPHKVIARQNAKNIGVSAHFNKALRVASSEIITIGAGDDISCPNRVMRTAYPLIRDSQLTFCECQILPIGDAGRESRRPSSPSTITLEAKLSGNAPPLKGAARTVRRSALTRFHDLDPSCPTEDTPSALRLLMTGNGITISEPLVKYRIHAQSLTAAKRGPKYSPTVMFKQIAADAQHARAQGIITEKTFLQISKWIRNRTTYRQIEFDVYLDRHNIAIQFALILGDRNINARQKIRLLKTCLKRQLT